jgi:predicted transcriptional regulator
MKSPCEEVVWNVLPAIRAAIAEQLVKKGVSQKDVSKMLGLSPPAVSQYVSKKRGYNVVFGEETKGVIEQLADDMKHNLVADPGERVCEICRGLRGDDGCSTKM